MTDQSILLVQSVTGAVFFIVALLLVAAIIGGVTVWIYAKSVYTPVIRGLETDKENLTRQVDGLNEDVRKLNSKIEKLNEKAAELEGELKKKEKELGLLVKEKK